MTPRKGPSHWLPKHASVRLGDCPAVWRDGDTSPTLERATSARSLAPLRVDGTWNPATVLSVFGPARSDAEYLARLVTACAVLQGPHRIFEQAERILSLVRVTLPKLEHMVGVSALAPRKDRLISLGRAMFLGKHELRETRARARNDDADAPTRGSGLRPVDLEILVDCTRAVACAFGVTSQRNVTGIDFALAVASRRPSVAEGTEWLGRVLGASEMRGYVLFRPREWERTVVVHDDGRLAYDPAPGR